MKNDEQNQFNQEALNQAVQQMSAAYQQKSLPHAHSHSPLIKALEVIADASKFTLNLTEEHLPCTKETIQSSLESACERSLFQFRKINITENQWMNISTPTLCFRKRDFSPIAIIPKTGESLSYYDPHTETINVFTPNIAKELSPRAYCFYLRYPTEALTPKNLIKFTLSNIWPELRIILFLSLIGAIVGLISPIATRWLFDEVIPNRDIPHFWQFMIALIIMTISTAFFGVLSSFTSLRLSAFMSNKLNAAIWDRLFSLPAPFFRKYSTGSLAQRMSAVETTRSTLTNQTMSFIFSALFSIVYVGPMLYYSWQLALAGMVSVILGLLISLISVSYKVPIAMRVFDRGAKIQGYLVEMISGITKIRMTNSESRAFAHWAESFSANQKDVLRMITLDNIVAVFSGIFPILNSILIFTVAYYLLLPNDKSGEGLTLGKLLAFQAAFTPFSMAIMQMGSVAISLIPLWPIWERAKEILNEPVESPKGVFLKEPLHGEINLQHVTFRYNTQSAPLFEDIHFHVKPREFVAIVGPSGSGKSTLLRLLAGLESIEKGNIYYDGKDYKTFALPSLRKKIGTVLQSSRIFAGTIRENITLGRDCSEEDIKFALKTSAFEEVLATLPMGLHTPVPNGGGTLSGGQRQRLLLARALAGRPSLLFLDEATSSLDSRLQEKVIENLRSLSMTMVVVAHRLSTIQAADRTYKVDNGKVVEIRDDRDK